MVSDHSENRREICVKKENFTETMALSRLEAFEQMLSAYCPDMRKRGKNWRS